MTSVWFGLTALLSLTQGLAQESPVDAPSSDGAFVVNVQADDFPQVAVVVGISTYMNLPTAAHLDYARSEAAELASVLREDGGYADTFLLADAEATRANVEDTLRIKAPQLVGRDGLLLFYYVGHGVGGDFDAPALFTHDSTLEQLQDDGLDIQALATGLATWSNARVTLLVTDAIHSNTLDGLEFIGPSATQWPGLPSNVLIISATAADSPGRERVFGPVFAQAMGGDADVDNNGVISALELKNYLELRLAGSGQTPQFVGNFAADIPVHAGIRRASKRLEEVLSPAAASNGDIYGNYEISKAKFIFRDGTNGTVQCRDKPVQVCDDMCYVHKFLAGPCVLKAIHRGQQVEGITLAQLPGRYDCRLRASGRLGCLPPVNDRVDAARKRSED